MEALPVHYAGTSDGFSIGYISFGEGPTLVYMPFSISNVGRAMPDERWGQTPQLTQLAAHLRVVRYDHRGQGASTRGLTDSHSMRAYEHDLEAVLDRFGDQPVVLMAGFMSSHVAVRFAARRPERVRALVLYRTGVRLENERTFNQELAANDWDLFLSSLLQAVQANENISAEGRRTAIEAMKRSVGQADWLQYARVTESSSVEHEAPLVQAPTLVLATGGHLMSAREAAAALAALIPNATLLAIDPAAGLGATAQPVVDFVLGLPSLAAPGVGRDGLSEREVEVLRLLARGRSNAQIAKELVISLSTVTKHVGSILGKTESANRTEAAAYAHRHGIA